jgi:hypothetical protein
MIPLACRRLINSSHCERRGSAASTGLSTSCWPGRFSRRRYGARPRGYSPPRSRHPPGRAVIAMDQAPGIGGRLSRNLGRAETPATPPG